MEDKLPILNWGLDSQFTASNQIYFPNVDVATIPIFRISNSITGSVGGSSPTVINGVLEVTGSVTFGGSGSKTFRNGIIGSGTVTQTAAGGFIINGDTAQLGGGALTLTSTGLDVSATTVLTVISNKVVNTGLFRNNGTMILGTNVLSGTGNFTQAGGATIITSNTGGVPASVAVTGTKTFTADNANYTFNAATATPFITGAGQSTKFGTVNINADVTNNISAVTTYVTKELNVNTGTFALNSAANSDLSFSNTGGVLNIAEGAVFDNGGENQLSSTGGTPAININGTFITRDAQGFTGTNTAIPGIMPTLGPNSTIVYGRNGDQDVTDITAGYKNISFAGSGTKTVNGAGYSIAGTISINSGVTLDAKSVGFGGSGTILKMAANSLFKTGGSGNKPDASGSYTLDTTSTIEFQGASATLIRVSKDYENVIVSGTNVKPGGKNLNINQTTVVTASGNVTIPETADNVSPNVITSKRGVTVVGNGILNLENNAQLMQDADAANVGNIVAKRIATIPNSTFNQYVYFSSPVLTQNYKDIFPGKPTTALYFIEATDKFGTSSGANITGRALAVRNPVTTPGLLTAEFNGEPFVGDLDYPLAFTDPAHGYNLVGNPYPSNLNLDEMYLKSTNLDSTFFFWDNYANSISTQQGSNYQGYAYATYNAVSNTGVKATGSAGNSNGDPASLAGLKEPNYILKVGQGIMVKATAPGAKVGFRNADRITDQAAANFFGKGEVDSIKNRYWLEMVTPSNLMVSNAIVYFDEGTNEFAKDDSKMRSLYSDALFTYAGNEKVVINGRSVFNSNDVLNLGTRNYTSGIYKIALGNKEGIFSGGQNIYLKDKQTNTITNLSEGPYTFEVEAGESTGRFEIVYKAGGVLATDGSAKESLEVYRDKNYFTVKSSGKKITALQVFESSGRLVYTVAPNASETVIDAAAFPSGVYVLKIERGGEITSRKILK